MARDLLRAVRCRKFQSQNFWTEFSNFWDYFQTFRAEFRDCFWTVWVEILGLFSDSPDRNFRIVFGQSRTMLRFGFDARTDVFRLL